MTRGGASTLPNDPAAIVTNRLQRLRRRAIRVRAVRYSLIAVPVGIIAVSLLALTSAAGPRRMVVLIGSVVVAGVAAGIIAAWLRAPTLHATAMMVDRRLHLENRAAAALQFVAGSDPVARLVVRDGAARLESCRPADAFALEVPRSSRWLLGGAVATVAWLAIVQVNGPVDGTRPSAPGSGSTGGSGRGTPRAGGPQPASEDAAVMASPSAPPPGSAVAATTPDGSQPPSAAFPDRTSKSAASPSGPVGQRPAGDARAGAQAGSAAANRSSDASGAPAGSAAASRGGSGSLTGAAGPGGGRDTVAATDAGNQHGGGVGGGALTRNASAPSVSSGTALAPAERTRYRAAWDRAQAALEHQRIPIDQRSYVKAYFEAVRSPVRQ